MVAFALVFGNGIIITYGSGSVNNVKCQTLASHP